MATPQQVYNRRCPACGQAISGSYREGYFGMLEQLGQLRRYCPSCVESGKARDHILRSSAADP